MILTCPQCDTRYQADEAKFPAAGRNVRCAKCGNVWHQAAPAAEAVPEAAAVTAEPEQTVADETPLPRRADSLRMRGAPAPSAEPGASWLGRLGVAAGWLVLVAVIVLIGFSAVRYRQEITAMWPQSSSVYSALGLPVRGLDFRDLRSSRESEDGQVVLAVSGTIFNDSARELPVPQSVLVTLSDEKNHEIYHWNFSPSVATLKPGQSSKFITRLSSPPATARHLEIRFAKDGS
jgi:predicted Zn finger-like uncharacterized protein